MDDYIKKKNRFIGVADGTIDRIKFSEKLINREKEEYETHQALWRLALDDLAITVRHNVAYPWATLFIEDAAKWISMQRVGFDKRKKYDEQQGYENFVRQLNQIFDRTDIMILDITAYNYSEAWLVRFITNEDFVFLLDIPNLSQITPNNVYDLSLGKLRFGYLDRMKTYRYVAAEYDPILFQSVMEGIVSSGCEHFSIIDDLDKLPEGWIKPKRKES